MRLDEVMVLIQNRINALQDIRKIAIDSGDTESVNRVSADLASTQLTLAQLQIAFDASNPSQ